MDELDILLSDLVSINSINPDLIPGAAGEAEIAHFIAGWLERAGLEVQLIEAAPGRPNVVGIARGTGGGKTLLLNGHMDTVAAGDMPRPHDPYIKDGRLYGRGAYDMKGGVAACMHAVAAAKKLHLRGDVIFTGVVDEEYASIGTMALAKRFHADGAVVAEFTELQMIVAHKGFVWLEVETIGKAAHGSRPDLGVDAIAQMGDVLVELKLLGRDMRAHSSGTLVPEAADGGVKPPRLAPHPLLGSGSIHASLIHGGRELSSYPEHCVLSVERRTLPGETPEQAEAELAKIVIQLKMADSSFNAVVRRGIDRSPLETPEDASIVKAVQGAARKVLGYAPQIAGVPFWTDAALLSEAGIPSLLFGPSGAGAHAAEEWVDLASVHACAEIYLQTAVGFCG
jgi:acetylornithine deacetylase